MHELKKTIQRVSKIYEEKHSSIESDKILLYFYAKEYGIAETISSASTITRSGRYLRNTLKQFHRTGENEQYCKTLEKRYEKFFTNGLI